MPDNISEILDPSVNPELKELNQLLQAAVTNIENVGKAAKGITIDFKGVKDIATLNELVAKKEAALKQMEDAEDKYRAARESKEEKALQAQIKREYDRELAAKKAIAAKLVEEDKAAAAKLKNAEKEEAILNKMIAAEERAAEKQNLIKQRQLKQIEIAAGKEAIAVNKAAEQATKAAEQKALAAEQAAAREEKAMAKLNNAYEQLKIKYKQAADEAKRLGAEFGVTDSRAVAAAASSMKMYKSLLDVEKSVGQAQRQVGQYNLATASMTQIMREVPSIANGLPIFLSAIGNNIGQVQDAVKQLNAANKDLVASGGKSIPVWRTLAGAILNWQSALILGITFLTIWAQKTDMFKSKSGEAAAAVKKHNEELVKINSTLADNIAKEEIAGKQYLKTAANLDLSLKVRVDAIEKLRKANEGLFDDYDDEYFLAGKTAEAEERLNKAIYARYVAQAFGEKAAAAMKKRYELTSEQYDEKGNIKASPIDAAAMKVHKAKKDLELFRKKYNIRADDKQFYREEERLVYKLAQETKAYKEVEAQIVDAGKAVEKFQKQQQDALQELQGILPENTDDNLQKLKAELSVRKSTLETMRLAKGISVDTTAKEVDALILGDADFGAKLKKKMADIKQLEDLIDKIEGKVKKGTTKKTTDITLKSDNDLIKAQYDLARQRLENERDNQKAISDNVRQELGDRLVAHQEYMNALMQLSLLERDRDIAIQNENIAEIARLRKTATGAANENLLKQDEAARTKIQEATEGHQFRLANITKAGKTATIDIIASANGEWIKSEEERNAKAKQVQAAFLYMEETNLHKAYKDKLISRKEYNSELAALQKEQQMFAIDSEIEFDKTILDNKNISAEKRKQFEEKLAKDLKTKAGLVKGEAAPKKSTGRLTDGLAKALGGGDMEDADLEQYQQEFWNRTVDLANKATDAIIAARNRQYDNERAQLEAQSEQIRINADTQTAIINATTQNDIQRQNMLTQLAIQTQAQQQVIEAKKRDISKKQAAFEKTAAVASIIQSTAVAIAAALKYPPPAAAVIIGLISTASAVQLAAVASAPTPAYKFGTDNHPGGAFIAGDGGVPELIIAPNKAPYFSKSVSTLYNEPAGTKVLPPDVIKFAAASTGILPQAYNDAIIDKVATKITKEFGSVGMQLSEVIWAARSKPANMDAIAEQMRRERNLQGH